MRYLRVICSLLLIGTSTGCSLCRGIEQWKCDTLGMCHFGTVPSKSIGIPQQYLPQPIYAQPPQFTAPQFTVPPPNPYKSQCQD